MPMQQRNGPAGNLGASKRARPLGDGGEAAGNTVCVAGGTDLQDAAQKQKVQADDEESKYARATSAAAGGPGEIAVMLQTDLGEVSRLAVDGLM